jgi:hypothetical protein
MTHHGDESPSLLDGKPDRVKLLFAIQVQPKAFREKLEGELDLLCFAPEYKALLGDRLRLAAISSRVLISVRGSGTQTTASY